MTSAPVHIYVTCNTFCCLGKKMQRKTHFRNLCQEFHTNEIFLLETRFQYFSPTACKFLEPKVKYWMLYLTLKNIFGPIDQTVGQMKKKIGSRKYTLVQTYLPNFIALRLLCKVLPRSEVLATLLYIYIYYILY